MSPLSQNGTPDVEDSPAVAAVSMPNCKLPPRAVYDELDTVRTIPGRGAD